MIAPAERQPPRDEETALIEPLQTYWDDRAARLGPSAVLHHKHPPESLDEVTHGHFYKVFDLVDPLLTGRESNALDFGCGAGRLTPLLTQRVTGQVLGVDPTRALINAAIPAPRVNYQALIGGTLSLPDQSIDLLLVFCVLGGIPDATLPATVCELQRVLHPDGLLVLVENTTDAPDAGHWFFRGVDEYAAMFSEVDLDRLGGYDEFGEAFSIMAGRPRKVSSPALQSPDSPEAEA